MNQNASRVILSAGAFGSPGILERSGVGNKTYLTTLGIESVVDLPGVGENLQEREDNYFSTVLKSTLINLQR